MRAILMYHSIDPSGSAISIDEAAFRAHVAFLASGAVRVVPLETLAAGDAPDNAVALTFDDAFTNFASLAWPLLRQHNLPATLYVVTRHPGTNAWRGKDAAGIPTMPLMDWDAVGRVAQEGVALGAHGRTHPNLRTLDDAALQDELAGSADDLEQRTGKRPTSFAYPYGGVTEHIAETASRTFTLGLTTELRPLGASERPMLLPRLDSFYLRDAGRLESWGTPSLGRYLTLRGGLRRLRSTLTSIRK